ncbi:PAS domain-containing protein [Pontibrevibacter nitratireducens]|uniref:PAS domain-containing protein n=1 Tax=Pontivivens nitratireducens TaxID=2758038 RepID=A0A6G7VM20_9RHOB|nr:PAS domain-containing protein [Pontibrevibacter nitratireducens]
MSDIATPVYGFFMADDQFLKKEEIRMVEQMEHSSNGTLDRFEAMISHLPGMLFRCHVRNGLPLIWIGGRIKETTGFGHADLLNNMGGAWSRLIHCDDQDRVVAEISAAMEAHENWQSNFRIVCRNGKQAWVRGMGGGVYDSDGRPHSLEGVIIDMTSQMEEKEDWQDRVQRARERTVQIVEATSDMLETLQSLSVLSINASIEAARAGDAGRGFSVVAQEMNRLAARAESTATAIRRATGSERGKTSDILHKTELSLSRSMTGTHPAQV